MFKKRIKRVLLLLKDYKIDSLLVSSSINILYLTGLRNIEGYLLISPKRIILFTDFRYLLQCKEKCKSLGIELVIYDFDIFNFIVSKIKKTFLKKVGFEAEIISYKEFLEFKKSFEDENLKFLPTFQFIENLRKIKEVYEINLIKKSIKITEQTFNYLKDLIYEGLTEKFIAIEAEKFAKIKGNLELAFPPIVATGKSSAYPHHKPEDIKIQRNKPILIDLGSKYYGYCSDLTRVFFLSKMPNHLKKIVDIVKKAKELSIKKIKEGVKVKEIDKAARSFIEKKGYGKFFRHSLGHGVGLEVHELPRINIKNKEDLREGMVITLEPAIYIPQEFGIREESMVLVKSNNAQVLDEYS